MTTSSRIPIFFSSLKISNDSFDEALRNVLGEDSAVCMARMLTAVDIIWIEFLYPTNP